jgi:hypothetical protein
MSLGHKGRHDDRLPVLHLNRGFRLGSELSLELGTAGGGLMLRIFNHGVPAQRSCVADLKQFQSL